MANSNLNVEIEKKYTIHNLPIDYKNYPCRHIVQGYLCVNPVVRVRQDNDEYYLTYKGKGFEVREEYNLPLNASAFHELLPKANGNIISKNRYCIPYSYLSCGNTTENVTIELDIFEAPFENLCFAEVEFESKKQADEFIPPEWFKDDVTTDKQYSNSNLSRMDLSNPCF